MTLQEANNVLTKIGIQVLFNKTLKLYVMVIDDTFVYITPSDFVSFDTSSLKYFAAGVLIKYSESQPLITFH